jgi:hypothetical protein
VHASRPPSLHLIWRAQLRPRWDLEPNSSNVHSNREIYWYVQWQCTENLNNTFRNMTEPIQITSGVWSWGKFTDAKKGGSWGMLLQKIVKTWCLRLAKNAFAIQHLLHHSIIYTFIHYPTNFVLLRWTCISEVIPAVQVAFFLLVRIFPLNLSFLSKFLQYIFLSWGNIFWEIKKFSGTNGQDTFSTPVNTYWQCRLTRGGTAYQIQR